MARPTHNQAAVLWPTSTVNINLLSLNTSAKNTQVICAKRPHKVQNQRGVGARGEDDDTHEALTNDTCSHTNTAATSYATYLFKVFSVINMPVNSHGTELLLATMYVASLSLLLRLLHNITQTNRYFC